jgi:hypothetical protein
MTKQTHTPTLGQDMGYQRDFQLWQIARKAAGDEANADNYRSIAACELQDQNAALVAALRECILSLEWAQMVLGEGDHVFMPKSAYVENLNDARALLAEVDKEQA